MPKTGSARSTPDKGALQDLSLASEEIRGRSTDFALEHAGSLLDKGYPEDCLVFLKENKLLKVAVLSERFTKSAERALEVALMKGLDHKAIIISGRFLADDSILESETMQQAAQTGALVKARQGYFDYAAGLLKMTGQNPGTFFNAHETAPSILAGLLRLGATDKDGLPQIMSSLHEHKFPAAVVRSPDFQKQSVAIVATRIEQIRSRYIEAATRMGSVMDFIETTDLQALVQANPKLMVNVKWIVNRLEQDGYTQKAEPIREFFKLSASA